MFQVQSPAQESARSLPGQSQWVELDDEQLGKVSGGSLPVGGWSSPEASMVPVGGWDSPQASMVPVGGW